jgi:DNA repair protein RadC
MASRSAWLGWWKMKHLRPPNEVDSSELVARILNKKEVDDECYQIACSINNNWSSLTMVAEEQSTATARRYDRVQSAIELGRRVVVDEAKRSNITVRNPEDVIFLCTPEMQGFDREHFWVLLLNVKNKLIRRVEVSVGSLNASVVHPREVYKEAVRWSAASVVLIHNHPSGDPTPSGADIQLTRRLTRAGETLGIELIDHIVIGGDDHASLRDLGLL